jgi:TetR/AcrR family transcriptional regulator
MGEIRNAERTHKNILEAARKEFFEKGFKGARIEAIAKKAGVKNQLIYHYFKGKAELLEAVLAHTAIEEPEWISQIPDNPVHIAEHRYKVNSQARADFIRFTAWEALESQAEQSSSQKGRERALQSYVAYWKAQRDNGVAPQNLEPELLTLAMAALRTCPIICGDVTKMITGRASTDPDFQARWSVFLTNLSAHLLKENDKSNN